MKKLFILFMFLLILIGCQPNHWDITEMTVSKPLPKPSPNMSYRAGIIRDRLPELVLEFSVFNNNTEDWHFGNMEIDVLIDDIWYDVSKEVDASQIDRVLKPGHSFNKITNLHSIYGDLPNGKYRAVLGNLSCTFEIER